MDEVTHSTLPLSDEQLALLRDMLKAEIPAPLPVWLDTVSRLLATLDEAIAALAACDAFLKKERAEYTAALKAWGVDHDQLTAALDRSAASQRALRQAGDGLATYVKESLDAYRVSGSARAGLVDAWHAWNKALLATAAPAKPLPTTESLTRADPDVTGWTGESDEATP